MEELLEKSMGLDMGGILNSSLKINKNQHMIAKITSVKMITSF